MAARKVMKGTETESDGPLSDQEIVRAAGLLHRAVVHGQNQSLVKPIARHIHGKQMSVHRGEVLEQVRDLQGMADSSKRRLDVPDGDDGESWEELSEASFMDRLHGFRPDASGGSSQVTAGYGHGDGSLGQKPKTQSAMLAACQELTRHNTPYPKGIVSVMDSGRTVVTMKKYANMGICYAELVENAETDEDAAKYLAWIKATFTPTLADLKKNEKRTQARDLAMFLTKIGWSKCEDGEFSRTLKERD
eukprot:s2835_g2.t1